MVEVLNGYRLKEKLPANIGEFTVPLGVPEVLREGTDVTVVTYGACCRIALEAAEKLAEVGIEIEVIDVQTLLPFDRHGRIVESLKKTNRVLFLDEDVPGGATAYMMQQVLEEQGGYAWLDAAPRTLAAKEHRPAYGSDGDYFSKPNRETVFEAVYELMHEADPASFPIFSGDLSRYGLLRLPNGQSAGVRFYSALDSIGALQAQHRSDSVEEALTNRREARGASPKTAMSSAETAIRSAGRSVSSGKSCCRRDGLGGDDPTVGASSTCS